jgi:hypothetical protein
MISKPESARQFLDNPAFHGIRQRLAFHAELLKRVKATLPDSAADHCLHCVAREDGGLVLYTDSQAFAAQFRFYAPSIQAKLNAAGDLFVKQIAVRNLSLAPPKTAERAAAPMKEPSPESIEAVKASSHCAPGDELGEALARLGASMERYAAKEP